MNLEVTAAMKTKDVWPVMLTAFDSDNKVDIDGLKMLIDFYMQKGVSGLFATCQSSEIEFLEKDELLTLCRQTVKHVSGRIPIAAGVPCGGSAEQYADLIKEFMDTGIDIPVVLSSHVVGKEAAEPELQSRIETILNLTGDIKLGMYECPRPYHRILSPQLFSWMARTGRFVFHKDTSCDINPIREKIHLAQGTPLKFFNAHGYTIKESLCLGGNGYSGITANYYPEICVWLCRNYNSTSPAVEEVEELFRRSEQISTHYPLSAKLFLQMRGVKIGTNCRKTINGYPPSYLHQLEELLKSSQKCIARYNLLEKVA